MVINIKLLRFFLLVIFLLTFSYVKGSVTIANAGRDTIVCGNTAYQLSANSPNTLNGETARWEIIAGFTGLLNDSSLTNATISGVQYASYQLTWTITDGIDTT